MFFSGSTRYIYPARLSLPKQGVSQRNSSSRKALASLRSVCL